MRLNDKVVLITGAANGIGREAAGLFCDEGARVVIADIASDAGEQLAGEIRDRGGNAIFVKTDVTDEQSVSACIETTLQAHGRLDVLYNNAGGSTADDGRVTEASTQEFWKAIRFNLFGTWLCCRFGIPHLVRAGGGSVINTASTAGLMGLERLDAYTAAKGGVVSLTRSMAVEFAADKVRVNAIAPTTTLTERVVELNKQRATAHRARNLLGAAQPRDIAQAALYLASDEARMVTGHILVVDSGLTVS